MPVENRRTLTAVEVSPHSLRNTLRVRYQNLTTDSDTEEIIAVNEEENFSYDDDMISYPNQEAHIAALKDGIAAFKEFIGIYEVVLSNLIDYHETPPQIE
jgi:hypothetical protein